MAAGGESGPGLAWLAYALVTVVTWGVYGVLLHGGQVSMGDPANGRYKAFLLVGIAYFLTAVLAPLALLVMNGASWHYPARGVVWSLAAGITGAAGAFCVLLAFGSRGSPAVVMSIVFAGAPVVNAAYALMLHPPRGGFSGLRWQFVLGIALAALGGCLVTLYKPALAPTPAAATRVQAAAGHTGQAGLSPD
jgi:hypothetical protein